MGLPKIEDIIGHTGRGRVGILIRIQFDDVRLFGLFARYVGKHLADILFPRFHKQPLSKSGTGTGTGKSG